MLRVLPPVNKARSDARVYISVLFIDMMGGHTVSLIPVQHHTVPILSSIRSNEFHGVFFLALVTPLCSYSPSSPLPLPYSLLSLVSPWLSPSSSHFCFHVTYFFVYVSMHVSVGMHAHEWKYIHLSVCIHVCTCMWRTEVNVRWLPQPLTILKIYLFTSECAYR